MRPTGPAVLLLPVLLLLGGLFAAPMALVVAKAADADAWQWLLQPYARSRIALAFAQAGLSLALVLAAAVPLAWLHHRHRIPGARALLAVQAATFVLPVFVVVAGLQQTLGAEGWLQRTAGVDLLATVGPLGTVALANAYYNTGLAVRLILAALQRRPTILEQAAGTLGADRRATFARVTLPLLLPALLATALLVFLFCFGSFGVVLLLGGGQVETLDTLLYANLGGAFPQEGRGAVLALLQLAIQAGLLAGCLLLERRAARFTGAARAAAAAPKAWATAVAWGAAALTAAPLVAVLAGAFRLGGHWSLAAWRALLDPAASGHLYGFDLGRAIAWSLAYAGGATAIALLLALGLAYAGGRWAGWTEGLTFLPLGTSSVALGFAFLLAFGGHGLLGFAALGLPAGGRAWLVLAAHTVLVFPFVARALLPALRSLPADLDASAATLGASLPRRIVRLHLPLVRPTLAAALGFAAVLSLGDLGASLLLMTDRTASLGVWIGRHGGPGAFDPLARAQSTALAAVLLALTVAVFLVAAAAQGGRPSPAGRARAPRSPGGSA